MRLKQVCIFIAVFSLTLLLGFLFGEITVDFFKNRAPFDQLFSDEPLTPTQLDAWVKLVSKQVLCTAMLAWFFCLFMFVSSVASLCDGLTKKEKLTETTTAGEIVIGVPTTAEYSLLV